MVLVVSLMATGCTCSPEEAGRDELSGGISKESVSPTSTAAADVAKLVDGAERVVVSDIDGDERPELVIAEEQTLRIVGLDGEERGHATAAGAVHVLEVSDLDGDGREEVLGGWGRSRGQPTAPVQMSVYDFRDGQLKEERIHSGKTSRAEVVAMVPVPDAPVPELVEWWHPSSRTARPVGA